MFATCMSLAGVSQALDIIRQSGCIPPHPSRIFANPGQVGAYLAFRASYFNLHQHDNLRSEMSCLDDQRYRCSVELETTASLSCLTAETPAAESRL
jgi:hypothetical protein